MTEPLPFHAFHIRNNELRKRRRRRVGREASLQGSHHQTQLVCVALRFKIEDAGFVNPVNPDTAARVDNPAIAERHAHVHHLAFPVLEKGQIAEAGFLHKIKLTAIAEGHLIDSVAGQLEADKGIDQLHKSGAVDA